MGRRVRKQVFSWNSGTSSWNTTPTTDYAFVYDGWTLDTPRLAGRDGLHGSPGALPIAACQGWNVVMVLDGLNSNAVVRKLTWGLDLSQSIHGAGGIGGLLACEEPQAPGGPKRYWFLYDGNGNVTQVLDATDTNNISIAAHYEYDPYGNVIHSNGPYADANPFRFSTKWFDEETHLGYWGYRYYSPRLGRWISRDLIGESGGLNLYAMVTNSTTNRIDPVGLYTPEQCVAMYLTGRFGTGPEAIEQYQLCLMLAGPYPPSPPGPPPPPTDVVISGHGCFHQPSRYMKCRICTDPTYIPDYLGNPGCDNPLRSDDVVDELKAVQAVFPTTVWLGHCGAGKMPDSDLKLLATNSRKADGPVGKPYRAIKRICACKGVYVYLYVTGYCTVGWKCVDVQ